MLAPSPSGAACSCAVPPRSYKDVEILSNQIVGVRPPNLRAPNCKLGCLVSYRTLAYSGQLPSRARSALGLDASLLSQD